MFQLSGVVVVLVLLILALIIGLVVGIGHQVASRRRSPPGTDQDWDVLVRQEHRSGFRFRRR